MPKNKSKKRLEREDEISSAPVKNCRTMNICQLLKILTRRKLTAIKWLQRIGLLDKESCCDNCGKRMSLVLRKGASGIRSDKYEWECTKCRMFTKSLRDGTLFQSSKLPFQKLTMLIYFWAHNFPSYVAQRELSLSERTVNRWYVVCQEACVEALVKNSSKIGGEGRKLEIFESKLGRRDTDVHIAASEQPVIGVIDVDNGNCFLQLVKTTAKNALLIILKKKVGKGSTLYSTVWETYNCHNDEQFSKVIRHRKLMLKNPSDDCENIFKQLHLKAHKHETDINREFSFDSVLCATIYKNSKKSEPFYFVKFLGEIGGLYRDQARSVKANQTDASETVPGPCNYQRSIINSFDDMEWSPVINFPCKTDVSDQKSHHEVQNETSDNLNVNNNIGPQESNTVTHTDCATIESLDVKTKVPDDCAVVKAGDPLKDSKPEPIPEIHSDASNETMDVEVNHLQDDSKSGEPSDDDDHTTAAGSALMEEREEHGSSGMMEKTSSDCLDLEEGSEKPETSSISLAGEVKPEHLSEVQRSTPKEKPSDEPKHSALSEEITQNVGRLSERQDSGLEDIILLEQSNGSKNILPEETVQSLQNQLEVISDIPDEFVTLNDTDKIENNKTGSQEDGNNKTGSQEDGNNKTGSQEERINKTGSMKDRSNRSGSLQNGNNKQTKNDDRCLEAVPSTSRQHYVIDISMTDTKTTNKETVSSKKLLGPTIDIVNIDDEDSDVEVVDSETTSVPEVTVVRPSKSEMSRYDKITHERRLLVDGLPPNMSKSVLWNYFMKWGKVVFIRILPDPGRKGSRYGLLEFSARNAINNVQAARPHHLDTKTPLGTYRGYSPNIKISLHTRQVKTVLVRVPDHDSQMAAEDLWQHFIHYGHISYIEKVTRLTSIGAESGSTTFTVCFEDYDSADVACMNSPHVIKGVMNVTCQKEDKEENSTAVTQKDLIYIENDSDVEELQTGNSDVEELPVDNNNMIQAEPILNDRNNVSNNSSNNEENRTGNKRLSTEENDSARKKLCNDESHKNTPTVKNDRRDASQNTASSATSAGGSGIPGASNHNRLGSNENNLQIKQEVPDWPYSRIHHKQKHKHHRRPFPHMCQIHNTMTSVNGGISNDLMTLSSMRGGPPQGDLNLRQHSLQQTQAGQNFHHKKQSRRHHQFRPYHSVPGTAGHPNPIQRLLPEGIPLMMNGLAVPSHVTRNFPQRPGPCHSTTQTNFPHFSGSQNQRL